MDESEARLFFGFQIETAWPKVLPSGRHVAEKMRHLTALFLGAQERQKIISLTEAIAETSFVVGPAGIFDRCLFFPKRHPRCVAWAIDWHTAKEPFFAFQKSLQKLFVKNSLIQTEERDFVPHVTLCRTPFDPQAWQKAFTPLPLTLSALHLFESLGHSTYRSLWKRSFLEAYREIEHTADMAFTIRGENVQDLHKHAELALAHAYPPFISYMRKTPQIDSLEELIAGLNTLIAHTDSAIGCPLKAVSYHGEIKPGPHNTLEWEMIIDV